MYRHMCAGAHGGQKMLESLELDFQLRSVGAGY